MKKNIPFNSPLITGKEIFYLKEVIRNRNFSGDGLFTRKCSEWLEKMTKSKKALLVTSCTHALEMTAILADIKPDDEVIMPSFTFVSTANAFVLRGAKIVFVDIRSDTLNIDEKKIEQAISKKTRAIVPIHYSGVGCNMEAISDIAQRHNLLVIEDAAQGLMAKYKEKALGSIGNMGCLSFHETKNYHCGEGGALLINDERFIERAQVLREKGTNRKQFLKGQVDKYSWVDLGSSYLPSELNAAFLYANLEKSVDINSKRLKLWERYFKALSALEEKGLIELIKVPEGCMHNAHSFSLRVRDLRQRSELIAFLKDKGIQAVFHYVPLHTSMAGMKFGRFCDEDRYTTKESQRLLRLPMYFDLDFAEVDYVTTRIKEFFGV